MLTVNGFRRLFDALLLVARHTIISPLAWSHGDDNTNTGLAHPTTNDTKCNDRELRPQEY